jgi:hypothetical protein
MPPWVLLTRYLLYYEGFRPQRQSWIDFPAAKFSGERYDFLVKTWRAAPVPLGGSGGFRKRAAQGAAPTVTPFEEIPVGAAAFGGLRLVHVFSRLMGSRTRRRHRALPWKGIRG